MKIPVAYRIAFGPPNSPPPNAFTKRRVMRRQIQMVAHTAYVTTLVVNEPALMTKTVPCYRKRKNLDEIFTPHSLFFLFTPFRKLFCFIYHVMNVLYLSSS